MPIRARTSWSTSWKASRRWSPTTARPSCFPAWRPASRRGSLDAHHLVNRTDRDVVYLEIGDRAARDTVVYPDDDIRAAFADDRWRFVHKDGRPY